MNDVDLCIQVVSRSCQPTFERLGSQGPPIGNGIWGIKWPRDRWRHLTPKVLWGSTVCYPSDSLASCPSKLPWPFDLNNLLSLLLALCPLNSSIVRENVWDTAKNVKSHDFLDLKNVKNVKNVEVITFAQYQSRYILIKNEQLQYNVACSYNMTCVMFYSESVS